MTDVLHWMGSLSGITVLVKKCVLSSPQLPPQLMDSHVDMH